MSITEKADAKRSTPLRELLEEDTPVVSRGQPQLNPVFENEDQDLLSIFLPSDTFTHSPLIY